MIIRDSSDADIPAIAEIYAQAVREGTTTFEVVVPDQPEVARRRKVLVDQGYPVLIARDLGKTVGFGYAGPYRERPGYRYTVEGSVFVLPARQGVGFGAALMSALIVRCGAAGFRLMVTYLGDGGNFRSLRLGEAMGFHRVGVLKGVGWKNGRWVDTAVFSRVLGDGDSRPPDEKQAARP